VKTVSDRLVYTDTRPRGMARQRVGDSNHKRKSISVIALVQTLVCLCAMVLLVATCQGRETPRWAPNVERTDITPSEWMVGCFAIDPMTDRLRASRAGEEIELTARRVDPAPRLDVVKGRRWYRVEINGSHLKYGVWTPVAASRVRLYVGSNGFYSLTFELSRSNDGLAGTYSEMGDVPSSAAPDIPVSLRRIPCVSALVR
jgi:hypothetical protein